MGMMLRPMFYKSCQKEGRDALPLRSVLLPLRKGLIAAACVAAGVLTGCRAKNALPQPGSKAYTDFTSVFYTGLAGLQVGDDVRAEADLSRSARLAPGEPATWVDWGILALRQRNYDDAAERLGKAHAVAAGNGQIE